MMKIKIMWNIKLGLRGDKVTSHYCVSSTESKQNRFENTKSF